MLLGNLVCACALLCIFLLEGVSGCTTFVLGKKATADGSVMCTHTNDGSGTTDPRFVRIPSADWETGSLRPIWSSPESYPRYVGKDRNATEYFPENCLAASAKCASFSPLGYIPQVAHTYAYYETTYGILNEHQVGIGESTCSGRFAARSIEMGGKALLSVDQLSQIALERATTAREAITIMGELSEQYGFYGENSSFEGGSESLLVIDKEEGWVFHILADPTGTSSIWVAARVPDDSVAVVANMFSIREVNLTDTTNFLGRTDMWDIAQAEGLWSPGQPKDFTATFSDGEYAHKYYSGRRMWGVFNRLAPSAGLSAEYGNLKTDAPYPFAVPVDTPVTVNAAFGVLRDWYEGTNYSTSAGLQGGAFGSPDRFSGNAADAAVAGNWERTIALFRTSDSFLVQARSWLPDNVGGVIWFGPHAAHYTTYVPITMSVLNTPAILGKPYQGVYDASTLFWQSRNIASLAQGKFSFMIEDIRAAQQELEANGQSLLATIEEKSLSEDEITNLLAWNVDAVHAAYTQLFERLLFKYADGYINTWNAGKFVSTAAGYPTWWLEAVGYENGPGPVDIKQSEEKKQPLSLCLKECLKTSSDEAKLESCTNECL